MTAIYDLRRFGFDKVTRHFQQITPAIQAELERFKVEIAQNQTAMIQSVFDETITSRSGQTRGAIRPFVRANSAGTWAQQPQADTTIKWLDQGTGIYGPTGQIIHIEAKNKAALHFIWHGQEFFRKSVNVKGIKPRLFIEKGIRVFQVGQLRVRIRELEQRLVRLARTVGWR